MSPFPNTIDNFTNPSPSGPPRRAEDMGLAFDAIEAIEAVLVGPNSFNVKGYGAKGDGTTDDLTSINATLTAAAVSGGVVYFPPGNYKISGPMLPGNNTKLMGCGVGATTITLANAAVSAIVSYAAGKNHITFSDMGLNGGTQAGPTVPLQWDACTDITIERCRFTNMKHAIFILTSGARFRIRDNHFDSVVDYAVRADSGAPTDIWIQNNYVVNVTAGVAPAPSAFSVNGAHIYITNNYVAGSVDSGVMVAGTDNRDVVVEGNVLKTTLVSIFAGTGARRTRIIGNDVASAGDFGLQLHDTTNASAEISVIGNIIHDCGKSGIQVEALQDFSLVNNVIKRVGTVIASANQQRAGIGIQDLSSHNTTNATITGNTIHDDAGSPTMTYGILVESAITGAVVIRNNSVIGATIANYSGNVPLEQYDVRDFGASGDGVTDDRAAIQLALTAANAAGGGIVFLPQGIYRVTVGVHPENANYHAALLLGTNVQLVGAGIDSTLIKLANTQAGNSAAGNSAVIMNLSLGAGNTRMRVADLTIDGNNTNQAAATQHGVYWKFSGDSLCERVLARNCNGTAATGFNATGGFFSSNCSNLAYSDCIGERTAGNTTNGFFVTASTFVSFVNCRGWGMTVAAGFSNYDCTHITYTDCFSYLNTSSGFDCEESKDTIFEGCVAGGTAYNGSIFRFGASQILGNQYGFALTSNNLRVTLNGCQARNNTAFGVLANSGTTQVTVNGCLLSANLYGFGADNSATGILNGCVIVNNTGYGALFNDANSSHSFSVYNCQWSANANDVSIPVIGPIGAMGYPGAVPAIPATTVALTNPFPFDATIYLVGGTVTVVNIGGTATGAIAGTFRLRATQQITLTYTVAPTWKWFLD